MGRPQRCRHECQGLYHCPGCLPDSDGITIDANANIWFVESNSNEIGRLSGGSDGVVGAGDDEICEFTKAGLSNPQLIARSGASALTQAFFTEGAGNSVSVLTQKEADIAAAPVRVCTATAPPPNDIGDTFEVHFRTCFWNGLGPGPLCTPSAEVPDGCVFGGDLLTDLSRLHQMGDVTVGSAN